MRSLGAFFFFFATEDSEPDWSFSGSTAGEEGLLIPRIASGPDPRPGAGCDGAADEAVSLLEVSDGVEGLARDSGCSPLVIEFLSRERDQGYKINS